MAYIRKLPSGKYQVQIRQKGLRPISKSFQKKKDATAFARKVEGDSKLAQALGDPVTNQNTLSDPIHSGFPALHRIFVCPVAADL